MDEDAVEVPIEDTFDLHPFRANEVLNVTGAYLDEARARGFRQVRVIHGRGIGVQRAAIQAMLRELDFVETFWDDAHLGATVVRFKD